MRILNVLARRSSYDTDLQEILNLKAGHEARLRLSSWHRLSPEPTPAWSLSGTAAALGIGAITLKDESKRSSLTSFKVLGAPNALIQFIQRRWPERNWTAAELLSGRHAAELSTFVVISATDGNHGRALAAAAQSVGSRCVIVIHANVSAEREAAIAAFGAEVVRIAGNYDDSVREAERLAQANGWEVVSDTSYDGYEEVPRDVMQGYGVIAEEVLENAPDGECPYTHVFLQGGVGGLAAGVVSHFWERYGASRPTFVVVEPEQADCLTQSAAHGQPTRATGSTDSVMAGLACGEVSPLAWRFLQPAVDLFMTISDAEAEDAMRELAAGPFGDVPVVAGESAVAGFAALKNLLADPQWRQAAGLIADARVLLISTEGATAPSVYERIVGRSQEAVALAQREWLEMQAVDTPSSAGGMSAGL